jgi:hypothetical protein
MPQFSSRLGAMKNKVYEVSKPKKEFDRNNRITYPIVKHLEYN